MVEQTTADAPASAAELDAATVDAGADADARTDAAHAETGAHDAPGHVIDPIARLAPGVIVAVWATIVWHEGIVSDRRGEDGRPMVISCSRRAGEAREEPWSTFAPAGASVAIVGYPSRLPARTVLARARAGLGRPWSLTRNCEHFARSCHGSPGSPTVAAALKILPIAAGALRATLAIR